MLGPNGVIDVLVDDEAAEVGTAKQYLGYFGGTVVGAGAGAGAQRALRQAVPETSCGANSAPAS